MSEALTARENVLKSLGFEMITFRTELSGMYGINRNGDIFSLYKMRKLNRLKHTLGYEQTYLVDLLTGKGKWYKLHRVVATHYLPNPNGYTDVNHKNGIKEDNRAENLEWCSHSDNIKHSYRVLGRASGGNKHLNKRVCCSNGVTYNSLKEASDATGCKVSNICMCCKGKIKSSKKFQFWYK